MQFGLQPGCVPVGTDNVAALRLIEDPVFVARTKHVDVVYHHIRERVQTGTMAFKAVAGALTVADVFTKPLGRVQFEKFRAQLGVLP